MSLSYESREGGRFKIGGPPLPVGPKVAAAVGTAPAARSPLRRLWLSIVLGAAAALAVGCSDSGAEQLVLYCGRSKSLVKPLIEQFEAQTRIDVRVRYGRTAQLAAAIEAEADRSPADVFWAQDAAALGVMVSRGAFAKLPAKVLDRVPVQYRNPHGHWLATSGRARVLAFSPDRIRPEELPDSIFDLTDRSYKNRVGWAPANASFQAFVTAIRHTCGNPKTRQWLSRMKDNGARSYHKNTAIIRGIADGEIDFGLPNHYYLLRFKKVDENFPVEQTAFAFGDIGNMVNVAGVGVLASSTRRTAALRFIEFLVSPEAQKYIASETFEYPVIDVVAPDPRIPDPATLWERAPAVDLDALDDVQDTRRLLEEVGLL